MKIKINQNYLKGKKLKKKITKNLENEVIIMAGKARLNHLQKSCSNH